MRLDHLLSRERGREFKRNRKDGKSGEMKDKAIRLPGRNTGWDERNIECKEKKAERPKAEEAKDADRAESQSLYRFEGSRGRGNSPRGIFNAP